MAQQYALDKLGWLQFEQLCSELLELEGGIAHNDWNGSADRCRYAVSGSPLGAPLLAYELPAPVLVQCAWMRGERDASKQISRLAVEQPAAVEAAGSYLLLCNADLSSPLRSPSGDDSLRSGSSASASSRSGSTRGPSFAVRCRRCSDSARLSG